MTLPTGKVVALDRIALHAARVEVPGLAARAQIPRELGDAWVALGGSPEAWDTAITCEVVP